MRRIVRKAVFMLCSLSIVFNCVEASSFEDRKKGQMIQDLEVIKHHFEAGYAPAEWKKEYAGWNLNEAFEQSKSEILSKPSITTKQFQQIVRNFVKTMKDYHVDVMFFSTERASLPFSVKGSEGRYFIDWVDPLRLPIAYYGIRAGDELIEFDQQPIAEVMAVMAKESGKSSNPSTDQSLAEMKLTSRTGMAGDIVPKGAILVTTKSVKNGKVSTYQLCWAYTPEYIKNPLDFTQKLDFISDLFPNAKREQARIELPKISMASPLHQAYAEKQTGRDGGLGSRKSFIPMLGEEIWSTESQLNDEEEIPVWYAYIYRHSQGKNIGYIRIPHYASSTADTKEFGKIINMMEEKTDALVIDQLHNFGGLVHIQYALASMLTHQPLQAPYHRIKLTQKEAMDAHQKLELIRMIELIAGLPEEEVNARDGENQDQQEEEENKLKFQELLFLKAYCELVLEDWSQGQTLTRPTPILGVDKINPHPKYRYSKPILMLINEMDFSGGDFIPAIFQDNKRALLFGSRTAGAGGYVFTFQFPNTHGISQCSYTASIAERTNLQKIENLGVSPDITYQLTLDDMQNGYRGYIEGVNQAVQTLLENP